MISRKHCAIALVLWLGMEACGGGGCGPAGELTTIPVGFPRGARLDNVVQARLSRSGVKFLEGNIGRLLDLLLPNGLFFPVARDERTSRDIETITCPDDNCAASAHLVDVRLEALEPHFLRATARIELDSRRLDGSRGRIPVKLTAGCLGPICAVDSECDLDINTRRGRTRDIEMVIELAFAEESRLGRAGYTAARISRAELTLQPPFEEEDLNLDCGPFSNIVLGFVPELIADIVSNRFTEVLGRALDGSVCTKRGTLACPNGSFPVPDDTPEAVCRFAQNPKAECVPSVLGAELQGDLGHALFGRLLSDASAPGQFAFAMAGRGIATAGGLSFFFSGGLRGMNPDLLSSRSHHPCVPARLPPKHRPIPMLNTFQTDFLPGTRTPFHIGVGITETFLNQLAYDAFSSGMLCIGFGTEQSQRLTSPLLTLFAPSLKKLSFPATAAPIKVRLRPQHPPELRVATGANPKVQLRFADLTLDFYVWSSERFVRFLTFRADVNVDARVSLTDGKISLGLDNFETSHETVTNSEPLDEAPDELNDALLDLLRELLGQLLAQIPPIPIPTVAGLSLDSSANTILGFDEVSQRVLGVYTNLRVQE